MMLRILFVALGLMLSGSLLQAQTSESSVSLNGFAGPMIQVSSFDGEMMTSVGGGAALLVNGGLYVGAYGMAMVGSLDRELLDMASSTLYDLTVGFAQFGGIAGYIINPLDRVQITVNSFGGFGQIKAKASGFDRTDRVFLISPHVGAQVVLSDWARAELNAGYRIMGKVNDTGYFTNSNLSAPFGGLTLRFGGFE